MEPRTDISNEPDEGEMVKQGKLTVGVVGAVLDEVQVVHVVHLGAVLRGEGRLVPVSFRFVHEAVDESGGHPVEAQTYGICVVLYQPKCAGLDLVAVALSRTVMALEFVLVYVHFGLKREKG